MVGSSSSSLSSLESMKQLPDQFDHEKLDVCRLELEFISWVTDLLEELSGRERRSCGVSFPCSSSLLLDLII